MSHLTLGLTCAGLRDIGLQRSTHQDSYYLLPNSDLFIAADGMEGHVGGQEASRLATAEIERYIVSRQVSSMAVSNLIEQAILSANEFVLADQCQHPEQENMGTTGDRLLLCSDGFTEDLSSDATVICLQSAKTCREAVAMLIDAAKRQSGRDNITAIALFIPTVISL